MSKSSTIKISVVVDDKGSVRLKKLGDVSKSAGAKGEKSMRRFRKSIADLDNGAKLTLGSISKLGAITLAGGVAAFAALTAGMLKSIGAASDLAEVQGKFDVVFDGQQGKAESWAAELVNSYAMSRRESKQYLSSLQDLLVPMGMVPEAAGKMSFGVTTLAADLGSFNNIETAQVMDDIQSALVGNYETMKKYGVVINATTVQEKALAMGLAATKDELTAADKAQAAYKMMLEGSAAAIGDMARTADGYANQLKQFDANVENLTAAMGKRLLPVAADVMAKINAGFSTGEGSVDSLAEVISVKLLKALGYAVETMRFFHNGWLGIKLVGTAAINAIAVSVEYLFGGIRNLLTPLDMVFDGLVQIGAIDVNPFDGVEQALGTFAASSSDVTAQVMADIEKTNKGYDSIKATIAGYVVMVKEKGKEETAVAVQTAAAVKQSTSVQVASYKQLHDAVVGGSGSATDMFEQMIDGFGAVGEAANISLLGEGGVESSFAGLNDAASGNMESLFVDTTTMFRDLQMFSDEVMVSGDNSMLGQWQTFATGAFDTFKGSLGDVLVEEFGGLGGAWGDLWDSMLQKMAAVIAEMAAKWAASKIGNMFENWDIFHAGMWDLKDDEVPAIIQQGEMIIPKGHADQIRDNFGTMGPSSNFDSLVASTKLASPEGWDDGFSGYFSDDLGKDMLEAIGIGIFTNTLAAQLAKVFSPKNMTNNVIGAQAKSLKGELGLYGNWADAGGFIGSFAALLGLGAIGTAIPGVQSIGGLLGGMIGDGVGDAFDLRGFEDVRDQLEDMGYSGGAIVGAIKDLDMYATHVGTINSSMSLDETMAAISQDLGVNFGLNDLLAEAIAQQEAAKLAAIDQALSDFFDDIDHPGESHSPVTGDRISFGEIDPEEHSLDEGSGGTSPGGNRDPSSPGNLGEDDSDSGWWANGGVVNKLMVPSGEDGWGALKFGEGVVDADTMDILSASIKDGSFGGSGNGVVAAIQSLKQELKAIGLAVAANTGKTAKILARFEYAGIPVSKQEAVA